MLSVIMLNVITLSVVMVSVIVLSVVVLSVVMLSIIVLRVVVLNVVMLSVVEPFYDNQLDAFFQMMTSQSSEMGSIMCQYHKTFCDRNIDSAP
jgi:hypothetical protein